MSKVLIEKRERIFHIKMDRPEALNALDDGLNGELYEAWTEFAGDGESDVAILSGEGKAFCAGADLKSWIPAWERATPGDLREQAKRGIGGGITRGLHRMTKPVIAAIHGHCVGGGFEIALACDLRVAAEDARFGSVEARLGLHSGDGGLVRLAAIAGIGVALELAMTARVFDAAEAYRLHLVNRVVPREEVLSVAEDYARMIIANSQTAVRSAKETIIDNIGRTVDDALRVENFNSYSCLGDFSEARERLKAVTGGGKR